MIMASKGSRSKLDHEIRARPKKALEASKEPRRPKTHWDHVIDEMVWLSKDFESERKWKLAQAKKVAIRASKGMLDQATRGEKRMKEEEQRLRKVALNISKDVKKFWLKIEKLVSYKHQLELDEKKKKALDKQLEFLLGQTERYSTMLAENLVSFPPPCRVTDLSSAREHLRNEYEKGHEDGNDGSSQPNIRSKSALGVDEDYYVQSEDEQEDDEHTIEEDEAFITKEEREEELAGLQNEIDLPLEELLKRYATEEVDEGGTAKNISKVEKTTKSREENGKESDIATITEIDNGIEPAIAGHPSVGSNGIISVSDNHFSAKSNNIRNASKKELEKMHMLAEFKDDPEDKDFILANGEEKEYSMDDETTLLEEEELAKAESNDEVDEIALLKQESEIPIHELLARYKQDYDPDKDVKDASESVHTPSSEDMPGSPSEKFIEPKQLNVLPSGDDETVELNAATATPVEEPQADCMAESGEERENENKIADAAAAARSAQPTGNTFSTTKVRTKFPFLLKYPLREYQHIGLDWLVTMYEKKLNGILADEMGLGKTIMTIALLAHLACEKGIWGPHLIVVPTSVMLNWETEFLKWCPAFKILTYFGSAKERRIKRQGWLKPNSFHVCITTYRLVIQDSKIFKRKKWKYLILDEAHLIKNWKSQRWQTLLNFNSKRRILLTGTPLQNDLMELWSLMHFLMPHIFQSHQEFKDWFSNPISGMVEGQEKVNKEVVDRLHNVLRPFLLRRLKRDVEKQLPMKHEHVIYCRLSKRQRNLYEDFIASSETQATLASSNFFGMISVIMQLRKVCNHPDLFEGRPIVSSFDMNGIDMQLSSSVCSILRPGPFSTVDLGGLGLLFTDLDYWMTSWESDEIQAIATPSSLIMDRANLVNEQVVGPEFKYKKKLHGTSIFEEIQKALVEERLREAKERAAAICWWNSLKCKRKPMYSTGLRVLVTFKHPVHDIHYEKRNSLSCSYSSKLADIVLSPVERFEKVVDQVESFMFAIPAARAPSPVCWCSNSSTSVFFQPVFKERCSEDLLRLFAPFRPAIVRRQLYFPDRRLIQFDCGKLQELAVLLRRLKSEGHRALIFTQMTKMLDTLEAFINLYGYTYMRLDGSTPPEERQTLMQRFNTNPKIFLFILSTRSGGVGINLVGADTVIFYDSDWNPAMDQQAQDRCHRIGQTREVHIYRLISDSTIEENILKKANQKRALDDLVIQSGGYNTEFFKKLDPMELFSGHRTIPSKHVHGEKSRENSIDNSLSNADVEAALKNAEDEADYMALKKVEQEEAVENQEFTEEAIGRLEDDDAANEDDLKTDETANHGALITSDKDMTVTNRSDSLGNGVLSLGDKEDDADMLADVRQMAAAAAAAGQAILSFESQLRPIDRYAIRFLELWDPIIDKASMDSQIQFEEREWELDRIEKLKEDMEAEMDDDEEPLVNERWDADFATEVYRQQVEALAQHQLMEELESEAKEDEGFDNSGHMRNNTVKLPKPKSKKKSKKAKFRSLKKGALASEAKALKDESSIELMSTDDECHDLITTSDTLCTYSAQERKRKKVLDVDDERSIKKSKKVKRAPQLYSSQSDSKFSSMQLDMCPDSKPCDSTMVDVERRPINRSKTGGKISITAMPIKRVLTIKPDKLKKKGHNWSGDCCPSPDIWLPQEDAMLCAAVHEYGPHWCLVSEILYGATAGGFYRGKFRHPVHCCERYRELIQRYVLFAADPVNNDKANNASSGKAIIKVTEDNIRLLLDVVSELPDQEPLLQKHFFALLYTSWRTSSHHNHSLSSSKNCFYPSGSFLPSMVTSSHNSIGEQPEERTFTNLNQCSKLLEAALTGENTAARAETLSSQQEAAPAFGEQLDVTLEIQGEEDETASLPSVINVSVNSSDPATSLKMPATEHHLICSHILAEERLRAASRMFNESIDGASLALSTGDLAPLKQQSLGKHKLPISDTTKSSKSKMKKTSVEYSDAGLSADMIIRSGLMQSSDSNVAVDAVPFSVLDLGTRDFDNCFPFDTNGELLFYDESLDVFPHLYDPGLLPGLSDDLTLPEYTDIG